MDQLSLTPAKISMRAILVVISTEAFSQPKLTAFVLLVNYNFALPVFFVIALAVFLFTAFAKQKDH